MTDNRLIIDGYADFLCGWGYIGKRRLARALDLVHREAPAVEVQVRWRPYLIDPTAPQWSESMAGILQQPELAEELAGCGPGSAADNRLRARDAAAQEGIEGDFGARWRASSWAAHRLATAALAHGPQVQDEVVEELYRLHFVEHRDLNDLGLLTALAERFRLPMPPGTGELGAGLVYLQPGFEPDDPVERATREALLTGRAIGVDTSPTFVINGRTAVAGAQPAELLADAILAAPAAGRQPEEVRRLRLAEALLDRKDPHGSLYLAEPLRREHPDDPNVRSLLARARAASASLAPARDTLAELVAQYPDDGYLRELYGRTLRRLGDPAAARELALATALTS
ncbi:DsbA family protein [Microlunatus parietis]|uniref:Putative DsbA family dithiol-disulfide isomerase n=1 Tax=Microlunatus parietis TaxID=682979 RepID=A0A7Y9LFI9_9ACTN|nr:DsbA family protein [Microlunatus parietis]NYE74893.1 putative DsbA family dithiol-disulfide isomerase [Microlunatus parietis]